jgi:integrase
LRGQAPNPRKLNISSTICISAGTAIGVTPSMASLSHPQRRLSQLARAPRVPAFIAALRAGISLRTSLSCFSIRTFSAGSRVAAHVFRNVASASRLERITSALEISANCWSKVNRCSWNGCRPSIWSPTYSDALGTINNGLQVVRRIGNLAAGEWVDEEGLTWLQSPQKIKLLPNPDRRQPNPLAWTEQVIMFRELPRHLADMALFAVNTGCRDGEICGLRWDWEVAVPELGTSVFIIPGKKVKNSDDRLVVLNHVARTVIEIRRGQHRTHVFAYNGKRVLRMLNSAWKKARARAALPRLRVHDLKHTFGRRLRAAGVSFEDRQDLLGHRSGRITTHYSAAELTRLIEAAERVTERNGSRPELVVLQVKLGKDSRKTPASNAAGIRASRISL